MSTISAKEFAKGLAAISNSMNFERILEAQLIAYRAQIEKEGAPKVAGGFIRYSTSAGKDISEDEYTRRKQRGELGTLW